MKLQKRNFSKEIEEGIEHPKLRKKDEFDFSNVVSTGSTILDLNISGGRREWGGIPGGVILEISGPAGSGKTAILASIAASVQSKGGQVMFLDPEARFDQQYAEIYGVQLDKKDYYRPDTVEEAFDKIYNWKPENPDTINVVIADSLAALSTELEMEDQDKMGMKRAKCFSEGLRKTARLISNNNWIIACSNQQRDSQYGSTTPGGQAIKYYCSLRISLKQVKKITKEKEFHGKKLKKELGIESSCTIIKSSLDDPYRICDVSIVFRKGIDNTRDELIYYKTIMNETTFNCIDKNYQSLDKAIEYIEQNNLETRLKKRIAKLWREVEDLFQSNKGNR